MIERRATYRLQLSPDFTFRDAAGLAGYVAELGVSHVHLSPCLEARRGSAHGYDVVDPTRIRGELGGAEGFESLSSELRSRGVGILLDIVPNHMAASHENRWWWDVLAKGETSAYASYFDIDWHAPEPDLDGRVLLPVLGVPLSETVRRGDVRVDASGPRPEVATGPFRLPVARETRELARRCAREGEAANPRQIESLLERQHYLLADWRRGAVELNYRRFANVSGLVGMRVEDDEVFEALHGTVLELFERGLVDGFRIDHIDGLRDPRGYLERLRRRAPDAWVVVEKVLTGEETLRDDWPVDGTTGYERLNRIHRLFVDGRAEEPLTTLYEEFTGASIAYTELEHEKKRLVLERLFAAETNRLTRMAIRSAEDVGGPQDAAGLAAGIRSLAASFPVYRTYVRADEGTASKEDADVIDAALALASRMSSDVSREVWVFLRDLLLLRYRSPGEREFSARFQQLTGPVMAKGVEDTAFYCFNRLTALNEVGADLTRFGTEPEAFHAWCSSAVARDPHGLTVVSTHDTKRSADVRLRIALLSEVPDAWSDAVRRWARTNERHKTDGMPDRNDEYLLYQTLVGTWPIETERVRRFAQKAAHEAKRKTAWTRGDESYDRAIDAFVEGVLADSDFISDLESFLVPLDAAWKRSSLANTLLYATAAGPPQIYRGDELWYLALVDPDNRRPVDLEARRTAIGRLLSRHPGGRDGLSWEDALAQDALGIGKLRVLRAALDVRRRCPTAFGPGSDHVPLRLEGPGARGVVAFERRARSDPSERVVVVAPRYTLSGAEEMGGTELSLPPGVFTDVFSDRAFERAVGVGELLSDFAVALLVSGRCAS